MECSSYRGVKVLQHATKVVERVFEHRIRQQIMMCSEYFSGTGSPGSSWTKGR